MMNRRSLLAAGVTMAASPVVAQRRSGTFPPGFLWGAGGSGHQTEGNNVASDLWYFEQFGPPELRSGDADNGFELWQTDLDLVKAMGLNTYRFSLEWARIEPDEGQFSSAMLDHYKAIVDGCRSRGLTPVVTFSHYTTPRWFALQGGWTNRGSPDRFVRFCDRAARRLAAGIGIATTLNEPNIGKLLQAVMPPGFYADIRQGLGAAARAAGVNKFSVANTVPPEDMAAVTANLLKAHRGARAAIKAANPKLPVGFSLAMADDQAVGPASLRDAKRAELYGEWLEEARADDYIGVQNYERIRWDAHGRLPPPPGAVLNFRGAEVYAPSLAGAVRYAHAAAKVPVLVTEHGVGTPDDRIRVALIRESLAELKTTIDDGVPVQGYIHWSLLDNFEFGSGFDGKFGLVAVDRTTFGRAPKPSAAVLGSIARRNAVPVW